MCQSASVPRFWKPAFLTSFPNRQNFQKLLTRDFAALFEICLFTSYDCQLVNRTIYWLREHKPITSGHSVCNQAQPGGGGYSLQWPIRGGSARKGYLFQASGI